jgi:hypothetical protein
MTETFLNLATHLGIIEKAQKSLKENNNRDFSLSETAIVIAMLLEEGISIYSVNDYLNSRSYTQDDKYFIFVNDENENPAPEIFKKIGDYYNFIAINKYGLKENKYILGEMSFHYLFYKLGHIESLRKSLDFNSPIKIDNIDIYETTFNGKRFTFVKINFFDYLD